SENIVVFSILPLQRLLGPPHQIASELSRHGHLRKIQANLAIAANPDTAILLARNISGVTLVSSGEEGQKLASLPLHCLFAHTDPTNVDLLRLLERWGLKTCSDLAELPEAGLAERV